MDPRLVERIVGAIATNRGATAEVVSIGGRGIAMRFSRTVHLDTEAGLFAIVLYWEIDFPNEIFEEHDMMANRAVIDARIETCTRQAEEAVTKMVTEGLLKPEPKSG
jgi:hypothetical protein